MYKIRRHRDIGDRIQQSEGLYEIVGFLGRGHYQIQMVFPPSEPHLKNTMWTYHPEEHLGGPIYQAKLGTWVEDVSNVRPFPFGE